MATAVDQTKHGGPERRLGVRVGLRKLIGFGLGGVALGRRSRLGPSRSLMEVGAQNQVVSFDHHSPFKLTHLPKKADKDGVEEYYEHFTKTDLAIQPVRIRPDVVNVHV